MGQGIRSELAHSRGVRRRTAGKAAFARLVAATGDPDVTPKHGYTPMMEAALNGRAEMVDALLAAGADKTRTHPSGKCAADFARDKGHSELAKRLE